MGKMYLLDTLLDGTYQLLEPCMKDDCSDCPDRKNPACGRRILRERGRVGFFYGRCGTCKLFVNGECAEQHDSKTCEKHEAKSFDTYRVLIENNGG
jgi:hypothetical protein